MMENLNNLCPLQHCSVLQMGCMVDFSSAPCRSFDEIQGTCISPKSKFRLSRRLILQNPNDPLIPISSLWRALGLKFVIRMDFAYNFSNNLSNLDPARIDALILKYPGAEPIFALTLTNHRSELAEVLTAFDLQYVFLFERNLAIIREFVGPTWNYML